MRKQAAMACIEAPWVICAFVVDDSYQRRCPPRAQRPCVRHGVGVLRTRARAPAAAGVLRGGRRRPRRRGAVGYLGKHGEIASVTKLFTIEKLKLTKNVTT